jgi:hypothetical protein
VTGIRCPVPFSGRFGFNIRAYSVWRSYSMLNVSRQVGIHLFYISPIFSFVICYHLVNRGNNRAEIFHKDQDYLRFTEMMAEAIERQPMRILLRKEIPDIFNSPV